ncbi:unnamed protein product [Darwinula stevensoni]|uniref:alpha-1,2-Mannosidase n=1 Tax=Darwinula stevensoni TaxID=69355 RepID=A0A7R9A148_9CRUS|nr:unnamed protein product [Darwinula stevensoni]CAG0882674.1 unnamed protein product [Darwinula stevensoni]
MLEVICVFGFVITSCVQGCCYPQGDQDVNPSLRLSKENATEQTLPPKRGFNIFRFRPDYLERQYGDFPESERLQMLQEAKKMFYFGYDNYMKHAFPKDELNPIHCNGRGPDHQNPDNWNINDILGDYSLTLVESLDMLAILGNFSEFQRAVELIKNFVDFDKNSTVQVFEATIRVIGSLLSAHLLMEDKKQPFGSLKPHWYDGELLGLARELGTRLLPAFEFSPTGLPYPRVNLQTGVPKGWLNDTCTAGAGSLVLEFGILSRLSGDPTFEASARRANRALWNLRSPKTQLFGNVVNVESGKWVGHMSGVGAGIDSFYEYLLKTYIMFGNHEDLEMFQQAYDTIKKYLRKGRNKCNEGYGDHPLYVNVHMDNGAVATAWIDALQAAFPAVQVLAGDVEEAICQQALYFGIWRLYNVLPERFDWQRIAPSVLFYPLRPELVESTYFLYQATKSPFYLHVGRDILENLNTHTRAQCGYATVHSVLDKSLEDRMESFFLSETCKYLYLLFDTDHYINRHLEEYLFSTEGHVFRLTEFLRVQDPLLQEASHSMNPLVTPKLNSSVPLHCEQVPPERKYLLPLQSKYLAQLNAALGLPY